MAVMTVYSKTPIGGLVAAVRSWYARREAAALAPDLSDEVQKCRRIVGGLSVSKLRSTPESVIVDSAQVDQQMPGHRVATLGDAIDNVLDLQVGDLG